MAADLTAAPNELYCDSASRGAAYGLFALMTGISEEAWCAAWMRGLDRDLWEITAGAEYGRCLITERQAALLRLLSQEAGGWWHWPHAADSPQFITRERWLDMIRSEKQG